MSVAGDCLKVLMLLHTSSKAPESQRSLMSLLLEAIVMVLLASENDFSQVINNKSQCPKKFLVIFHLHSTCTLKKQEVKELKTASMRLVSQLAQSQTSAVYFKDALLSMPFTRRQKLQVIDC